MSPPEDRFIPDDPALYGPDPGSEQRNQRPLREVLGITALQFGVIVATATILFLFLGGPVWSAGRHAFPLRLLASYLIIPALVLPCLWWNGRSSLEKMLTASLAAAGAKFALTAVVDVVQGLTRHWPP